MSRRLGRACGFGPSEDCDGVRSVEFPGDPARAGEQFRAGFGVTCGLVPGREEVARVVLGTSQLTALLLTSMIEWFTQLHYVEHVRDIQAR